MEHIKQFLRKVKVIDIAIAVLLLIALGLAGYVQMERTREMGDTAILYTTEENREIRQDSFQTSES